MGGGAYEGKVFPLLETEHAWRQCMPCTCLPQQTEGVEICVNLLTAIAIG